MIQRDIYLKKLIGFQDKQIIKVITGIRRCGKSTLLEIFRNHLKEQGVDEKQIISINFEDMDFSGLMNAQALYSYVKDRMVEGKMNYVFLDEIQHVADFPKAVDSLFIKKNVDLYITGSNAYMLSGEIGTLLSGRYVEIKMLPLSFKEYVQYLGNRQEIDRKFSDYLRFSSFPYATELSRNTEQVREYLGGIYNTVLLKDVAARKRIVDIMMLESIIRFLFGNIGNICSTKKISDTMTSDGRKISVHSVEWFLQALMDSFIIYQAKRYDIKGKQYLKSLEKYYVVDIGLRYYLLGNKGIDMGYILENVVYLELIRRGYDVFIGKVDNLEVDFIAMNQEGIRYYQVAASARDAAVLERELRPLQIIPDHYPKAILTLDEDPPADYNGIQRLNALDFLFS